MKFARLKGYATIWALGSGSDGLDLMIVRSNPGRRKKRSDGQERGRQCSVAGDAPRGGAALGSPEMAVPAFQFMVWVTVW